MDTLITLLVGDPFLREEQYLKLEASVRGKITGEIALQSFFVSAVPLENILSEARTLPFLAAAQVFRIREADLLKKGDLEILEQYAVRPSLSSYLVFEADRLERKEPWVELLGRIRGKIEFLDADQKEAVSARLIRDKLKQADKAMTSEDQEVLQEMMGEEPALLNTVLDQLITYAGPHREINHEMVESFQEKWSQTDGYELLNAICNRQPGQAIRTLYELLAQSDEDMVWLVGLLHWQFRRLWLARVLLDEGRPESLVLKRVGIYPKQAPFFLRQLKRFRRAELERALEQLFRIDWKMKTGRLEGTAPLEAWVVELAAPAGPLVKTG